MLIKEFISKTKKDVMLSTLLQHYKVENLKIKFKNISDYAHFNVDTGTLELSSKFQKIKPNQVKDFLLTILHEIKHAIDAKKLGWRKFKQMYEMEQNMIAQGHYSGKDDPYSDNKFEIDAENFAVKNVQRWISHFSKK